MYTATMRFVFSTAYQYQRQPSCLLFPAAAELLSEQLLFWTILNQSGYASHIDPHNSVLGSQRHPVSPASLGWLRESSEKKSTASSQTRRESTAPSTLVPNLPCCSQRTSLLHYQLADHESNYTAAPPPAEASKLECQSFQFCRALCLGRANIETRQTKQRLK